MKNIILISTLALALSSCSKEKPASAESTDTQAAKSYPLEVCIVSDEKLGSMGEPVVIEHEGQEVKFCCDSCIPSFKKDPEKYLSKLSGE
ncbi:MAG: hypothetical protein R3242_04515 [Akkermansiaceae bacterium]|nr:hypothetical protein [Akkermansiaceae bacterium]